MRKHILDPQPYAEPPAASRRPGRETCAIAAKMVRSSRFKELHNSSLNEAMQLIATVTAGEDSQVVFVSEALPLKHWQAARTALLKELLGHGWLLDHHDHDNAELWRDYPPSIRPAPLPGLLAVTSDDEVFAAFAAASARHGLPAARVGAVGEIAPGQVYDVGLWDGAALAADDYSALCRHALALIWVESPAGQGNAAGADDFGRATSAYHTHREALATHGAAVFDRVLEQYFGRASAGAP